MKVEDNLCEETKPLNFQPGKVPEFVISTYVSLRDTTFAPSENVFEYGIVGGRKWYVQSLFYNIETIEPNDNSHALIDHPR